MMTKGKLYLVPAPLDFGCEQIAPIQDVMPLQTLQIAARLSHFVCENAKSTRAYLKRVGEVVPLIQPVQALQITELPREVHKKGDHTGNFDARPLLNAAFDGHDIGLVSEAGMPAIADPGSSVARAAHDLGLQVIALTGPMSLMLALASSGLNGQNFAFVGYLPQDSGERSLRIKALESLALKTGQTQIFIETPYRNNKLLEDLVQTLHPETHLCIATDITLPTEYIKTKKIAAWKKETIDLHKRPTIFIIHKM